MCSFLRRIRPSGSGPKINFDKILVPAWPAGTGLVVSRQPLYVARRGPELLSAVAGLIVWIGIGGMMAAFSGPLIIGALWRGVTRSGAYAGLISGMGTFVILHAQLLDPLWFENGSVTQNITGWLLKQGPNPFACTFLGEIVSVLTTILVSKFSAKLPREHLDQMF